MRRTSTQMTNVKKHQNINRISRFDNWTQRKKCNNFSTSAEGSTIPAADEICQKASWKHGIQFSIQLRIASTYRLKHFHFNDVFGLFDAMNQCWITIFNAYIPAYHPAMFVRITIN